MNDLINQQNESTDFLLQSGFDNTPNRWNTSSKIPTYDSHDPGYNPTRLPSGSSQPNGMPSGWNQEGGRAQSFGGGSANVGCLAAALVIGAIVALAIIAAGMVGI